MSSDLAFYTCYYLCQQQRVLCLKQTISSSADCPSPDPPAEVRSKLVSGPPRHNWSHVFAANGLCSDHDAPDFPSVSGFKSKNKSMLVLHQTWQQGILWSTEEPISFQCSVGHYLLAFWMVVCWSSAHSLLLLDRTVFIGYGSFIAQVRRCVVCCLPEAFLDILSSWGEQVTQDL